MSQTEYRDVTEADIGKIVEVRNEHGAPWHVAELEAITLGVLLPFAARIEKNKNYYWLARIKVEPVAAIADPSPAEPVGTVKQSLTVEIEQPSPAEQPEPSVTPEPKTDKPKRRVIYLAGPMTGHRFFNYRLFDEVRDWLHPSHEVISPADEDRLDGFDPFENEAYADPAKCVFPAKLDKDKVMRRCMDAVMRCDEIAMLPGWHTSTGAVAELHLAIWASKPVMILTRYKHVNGIGEQERVSHVRYSKVTLEDATDLIRKLSTPDPRDLDILDEAARITRSDRNASYGPPSQDFARTAAMWTALFQAKLNEGQSFGPRDVSLAMILLKCSRESHQRKRDNWVDIAGYARCGSICTDE